MIKRVLFVLILLIGSLSSKAELYYCVNAGSELSSSTPVMMVYIRGGKGYVISRKASEISAKLYSNSNYWNSYMSQKLSEYSDPYVYDSSLSTSSYTVYRSEWRGASQPTYSPGWGGGTWGVAKGSLLGYHYKAISKDGETIISWKQRKGSEEILNKEYYEVIRPTELNKDPHDFLQ